jgi:hypothetical protein
MGINYGLVGAYYLTLAADVTPAPFPPLFKVVKNLLLICNVFCYNGV